MVNERVEVASGVVTRIANTISCRWCNKTIDVEKVFIALVVTETPELLNNLPDNDKYHITSIAQAHDTAARLDINAPLKPLLLCEYCGGENTLEVSNYSRRMLVPSFLWCSCGQEVDLRYPGDSNRVRFMAQFPHVPFLHCRKCRQKMLIPIYGKDSWRTIVFRAIYLLRKLQMLITGHLCS